MTFLPWMLRATAACSLLLPNIVSALTTDEWRSKTIYQVMTDRFAIPSGKEVGKCDASLGVHCGGTWKGIYEHLDYIQEMNFDAIWISPIVANMPNWTSDGEGYAGYWQQSLYEINQSFGSEDDLVQLIDEVHRRGMLIMLDIVVNHMAVPGPPRDDIPYDIIHPFNKPEYYHSYCPGGYDDTDLHSLQDCWLGGDGALLVDLDSESDEVKRMLGMWIKNQIWKYGIDGLRIDAAINVPAEFFTGFMKDAEVFATGEVYTPKIELACEWSSTIGSILNYPLYFQLTYSFEGDGGDMQALGKTISDISDQCQDVTVLGNFAEVCIELESAVLDPQLTHWRNAEPRRCPLPKQHRRHGPREQYRDLHHDPRRHPHHLLRPRAASPGRHGAIHQPRSAMGI